MAAKYAAVSPAAPPPSTATCVDLGLPDGVDDDEDARGTAVLVLLVLLLLRLAADTRKVADILKTRKRTMR